MTLSKRTSARLASAACSGLVSPILGGRPGSVGAVARQDFRAFPRALWLRHPRLGHHERRVDEAFFFIKRGSVAKLVGNIRQHATQNPLLHHV
jgi:hypothetical protein